MNIYNILGRRNKDGSHKKRGFTIIELLVVIAIVGLLSTIVLRATSSARSKARDSRRVQDLEQIRNALELYYTDNGRYPYSPIEDCISWGNTQQYCATYLSDPNSYWYKSNAIFQNSNSSYVCDYYSSFSCYTWDDLEARLKSPKKYIQQLPRDPKNNNPWCYAGFGPLSYADANTIGWHCGDSRDDYGYGYTVSWDGQKYELYATLENKSRFDCGSNPAYYINKVADPIHMGFYINYSFPFTGNNFCNNTPLGSSDTPGYTPGNLNYSPRLYIVH